MRKQLSTMLVAMAMFSVAASGAIAHGDKNGDKNGDKPRVKQVDCDEGKSLQKALDKAKNGDTIEISGTCTESIIVRTDRITLDCGSHTNASITGVSSNTNTIRVEANNVTVTNCTIFAGGGLNGAILVVDNSSANITGNDLTGNISVVAIAASSSARVTANMIQGGSIGGMFVNGSSHADIFDNEITGNGIGILVQRAASADIVGNVITGNTGRGILIEHASSGTFRDVVFGSVPNTISNNGGVGIRCQFNSAVRFGSAQDFTPANTNVGGNTSFSTAPHGACAVQGDPGP